MASLVRPWVVHYIDPEGKRVPKGTKRAKKVRVRSSKWYGQGIPTYPPRKRFPLATDKEAAKRMLADLVRRAERGQALVPDRDAARLPLKEHLKRFEADMRAGIATKGTRRRIPPSEAQVQLIVQRIRDILEGCGFDDPPDLNAEAPAKLAAYLDDRVGKTRKGTGPRTESGISAQTAVYFMKAIRRFVRWLAKRAPIAADLFEGMVGYLPHADRKHARRHINTEELASLIEAAE
ncbi:MAG TPA: hypothetical protein VGI99_09945, partial [Gemmataceae bacterium]